MGRIDCPAQRLPVFSTDNFLSLDEAGKTIILHHNDMDVLIVGNFDIAGKNINVTFPSSGKWYGISPKVRSILKLLHRPYHATGNIGSTPLCTSIAMTMPLASAKIPLMAARSVKRMPNPFDDHLEILVNTDALEPIV